MSTGYYDTAVVIGRFQPLHNGHLALIEYAAAHAKHVVVIVGGRGGRRTEKDPWTTYERTIMLWNAVPEEIAAKMCVAAVADCPSDDDWRESVEQTPYISGRTALFGHKKDASSAYLSWFTSWDYMPVRAAYPIHATDVRRYLRSGAFQEVRKLVPPSVFVQIVPWCVGESEDV